ncbi:MAG TPA: Fe-S-binding domain-containing protein, partial [Flavobacteriales bacterium]|nr:Fe-S-binding domain-containing protein [Flavobacteriales bacterium]
CLVEVAAGSAKDPRPMPKLVASCSTPVMDGMVVKNKTSQRVYENRAGVVEFLLINHPLDCPICDQAGECHLQDLGFENGKEGTRYEEKRRTFEPTDIGPYVKLHMNRCILCYRCTYVADQLTNGRSHGVIHRGEHAEISTYIEKAIENDFSGNIIDVCPVGALTDKTFRFKSRVWFLKPMQASCECNKCSGKAVVWMYGNEIFRVTARKDQYGEIEDINGKTAWICNECRFDKKDVSKWTIEGPRHINRHSVISQNHYELKEPDHKKNKALN